MASYKMKCEAKDKIVAEVVTKLNEIVREAVEGTGTADQTIEYMKLRARQALAVTERAQP